MPVSPPQLIDSPAQSHLSELEIQVIDFFIRGVQMLGLPKSIGELYGLLYISPEPMPLDELVGRLEISKGSGSQGLRFLKNLGAINTSYMPGDRRDHYSAETSLKKLVVGFLKSELVPHMESGNSRLNLLSEIAEADESDQSEFRRQRIEQLERWRSKGSELLELVETFIK
jgi:DNA-binding transcriptional regulator GbsR (MarR family)